MIQGHTFSALLRSDAMDPAIARLHTFLHGLTAPSFLLGAGLAFGTATYGRYAEHRAMDSVVMKRLRRYAVLLLVGYALQLPGGSLWKAWQAQGDQLALVCRVGPLQLIGIVLCVAQLAIFALPTARTHAAFAAILGLLVILAATPFARLAGNFKAFFGAFLANDTGGSHFPIFPWAAFVLMGIGTAGLLHQREHLRKGRLFAVLGALLAGVGYEVFQSAARHHDEGWLWRTTPSYLVFRLGLVMLLLGLLHVRRIEERHEGRKRWSALLSTHSLLAYVVHLLILYGTPFTPGLAHAFGKSLTLMQTSSLLGAILIVTLGAAHLWDWLEQEQLLSIKHKRAALAVLSLLILAR
jgi:uncharacterized membrane protein